MNINILITTDNDEPLINETYSDFDEAHIALNAYEYEIDARADNEDGEV